MSVFDDLRDAEKTLASLQTKQERLKGQRDQLMKSLKEQFGCDTVEEGEELFKKKETRMKSLKQEAKDLLGDLEPYLEE